MCRSPNKLPDGTLVGCRECWQCRERKVDDWVGRCIAESKTAIATHSITLTYGRDDEGREDHLRAAVLTYSDVQKYFKRLRSAGYLPRYFAVGEYGSTKGRAHWHLIVYWRDNAGVIEERKLANLTRKKQRPIPAGPVPEHELNKRFMQEHWKDGYSHWEVPGHGGASPSAAIRYVCKYIQKDIGEQERQGHLSMSKKPPLGADWFRERAGRYVRQGLAPQDLFYAFNDVVGADGNLKQFLLTAGSASADLFCAAYLEQWAATHGGHPPSSPVIEEYWDRMARAELEALIWLRKKEEAEKAALAKKRQAEALGRQGLNGAVGFIRRR